MTSHQNTNIEFMGMTCFLVVITCLNGKLRNQPKMCMDIREIHEFNMKYSGINERNLVGSLYNI